MADAKYKRLVSLDQDKLGQLFRLRKAVFEQLVIAGGDGISVSKLQNGLKNRREYKSSLEQDPTTRDDANKFALLGMDDEILLSLVESYADEKAAGVPSTSATLKEVLGVLDELLY